jgi:dual specificity tyrosine-phosphorylation-regulated kinase 2/3/4
MIVFEILGLNLYELLKRNSFRGLSSTLIKRISKQVLESLKALAKEHVIHCDLKPENILLSDANLSLVKLIDFGSSCFSNQRVYTYIQSRFYRAPEVVLGIPYSSSIDIWSFGCILVELYTGIPIFPCETEKELICRIIEVLGEPPKDILSKGTRTHVFFDGNGPKLDAVKNRKAPGSRLLRGILKGADEDFILLVEACLKWDPTQRTNAENALRTLWLLEDGDKNANIVKKKYKISIEDITKHTPQLQKFIARRNNTLK